jgi:molybdenum cofactor cytidylyltransferase
MIPDLATPVDRSARVGRGSVRSDGGATVGGVLLAAGMGTRFEGGNKLLAEIDGEPVVRRAARTLVESSVSGVVAVLGHQAGAVEDALGGLCVSTRPNARYEEGQSTSVAVGVDVACERGWDGAVFALGDMPFVDRESVDRLVRAYVDGVGTVLAPEHDGSRGNPVLFDSQHFDALADVTGDRGGRDIVESEGTLVSVDDDGILYDIDKKEDMI